LSPTFFNNDYRYRTLKPNVPGLSAIKPTTVNGVDGFEFMVTEPPYGVRALTTNSGTVLLVTSGQCQAVPRRCARGCRTVLASAARCSEDGKRGVKRGYGLAMPVDARSATALRASVATASATATSIDQ
jgi:hypothetical protein